MSKYLDCFIMQNYFHYNYLMLHAVYIWCWLSMQIRPVLMIKQKILNLRLIVELINFGGEVNQ